MHQQYPPALPPRRISLDLPFIALVQVEQRYAYIVLPKGSLDGMDLSSASVVRTELPARSLEVYELAQTSLVAASLPAGSLRTFTLAAGTLFQPDALDFQR